MNPGDATHSDGDSRPIDSGVLFQPFRTDPRSEKRKAGGVKPLRPQHATRPNGSSVGNQPGRYRQYCFTSTTPSLSHRGRFTSPRPGPRFRQACCRPRHVRPRSLTTTTTHWRGGPSSARGAASWPAPCLATLRHASPRRGSAGRARCRGGQRRWADPPPRAMLQDRDSPSALGAPGTAPNSDTFLMLRNILFLPFKTSFPPASPKHFNHYNFQINLNNTETKTFPLP